MAGVLVQFAPEFLGKPRDELEKILDREVQDFSDFMKTIADPVGAGPLMPLERALIKTYLVHKIRGRVDNKGLDDTET